MNPQLQQAGNICWHFLVDFFFHNEKDGKRWALTNTGFTGHQHRPACPSANPQAALLGTPLNRSPAAPSCLEESKGSTDTPKFSLTPGGRKENKLPGQWTPFFFYFRYQNAESKKGMSTEKPNRYTFSSVWGPFTFSLPGASSAWSREQSKQDLSTVGVLQV